MYVVVCHPDITEAEIGHLARTARKHGGYFFHERRAFCHDKRHIRWDGFTKRQIQGRGYTAFTLDLFLPGSAIPFLQEADLGDAIKSIWLRREWWQWQFRQTDKAMQRG